MLALEDLKHLNLKQVKDHIARVFDIDRKELARWSVLIAYESVGSWGCDSSNYFLLRCRKTKRLFEARGSHCSCYGFEGQWKPERVTLAYLKSDKHYVSMGGYDSDDAGNREAIAKFVKKLNPAHEKGFRYGA